ncbi:5006_t:CDS:1, partial [Racocetra persica]
MIYDLASEELLNNDFFSDKDTVFELDEEIQSIDFDYDEIISNITKQSISIKNLVDTTDILDKIKQNIYNTLIYYWNDPNDLGLITTLLNPHYKSLDFLSNDSEKQFIIQKLHNKFSEIEES